MNPATVNELIYIQQKYVEIQKQHFYNNVLFSYQWWVLFFITASLMDHLGKCCRQKKNEYHILLVGLITSLIALVLDDLGVSLALWLYP